MRPARLVLGDRVEVGHRDAALVADALGHLLRRCVGVAGAVQGATQVVDHHGRAVSGHPGGDLGPEASPRAGHDHNPAL